MATRPISKRHQSVVLALLVISVCINYMDRGNLGVAAKAISSDLHFTPNEMGLLLGVFFWTYAFLQIGAGKLIDYWNVNWVLAGGLLLWSAATFATGLVYFFVPLVLLRLVLGAGESVAYPAYSKIIAKDFDDRLRGTANGFIDAGSKLGPALGVLIGVKLMGWAGWRGMFFVIGALGIVWLIPWYIAVLSNRRPVETEPELPATWTPSYQKLLATRPFWGTVLGLFGANYAWYFLISWLPYYFETELHFSHTLLAIVASLPFWVIAASSAFFGVFADLLVRQGLHSGRVHQSCGVCGLAGTCIFMFASAYSPGAILSVALLVCASIFFGAFSSNHFALTQWLSGRDAAGKWTGLENCQGNFAGILAPWITGVILQSTHSFFLAFVMAAVVLAIGTIGFSLVVGKPEPVEWGDSNAYSNSRPCPLESAPPDNR